METRHLERILQTLEANAQSILLVPGLLLGGGILGTFIITALLLRWARKRNSRHLVFLLWARWVGVSVIVLYSVALVLDNAVQELGEVPSLARTSLLASIRRVTAHVNTGARIATRVVLLVFGALVLSRLLDRVRKLMVQRTLVRDESSRAQLRATTLDSVTSYVSKLVVGVVVCLSVLQAVGLNIGPLLATAGVASVAVGFGAQSFVKDVLAGFFILLEDQFAVGDVIVVDGRGGLVESMSMRVTKLRGSDGSLHVIPNGEIKAVQNLTTGWSRVDFSITVPATTDLGRALDVLKIEADSVCREMPEDVLEGPEVLGVDKITAEGCVLRVWIKTVPTRQWVVGRAYHRRVSEAFQKEGIEAYRRTFDVEIHDDDSRRALQRSL